MFEPLLIHNDNTVLTDKIQSKFSLKLDQFDFENSDLDTYISKKVIPFLMQKNFNILFIKDNLLQNYIELYGILLAYHIRLSSELDNKRYVPIVIISELDGYILNKIEPMSNILFTRNIFIGKNEVSTYKYYKDIFDKLIEFSNFQKEFLELIKVEPAENFTSHSITNEWSIERWSYLLGIEENDIIKTNREKVSSMLYFKYLNEIFILDTHISTIKKDENLKGKLLFIDDRGSDGWNEIVQTYVNKCSNIIFKALDTDYQEFDSIKKSVKDSIDDYNPNIILLDLRLLKDESKTINKISGIKILEYIKKLDPSIQVLMFTASNDSDILDALYSKGIFGFVKKDAPTDKYVSAKSGFKKLNKLIKDATNNIYLKDIYQTQQEIINLDIFEKSKDMDKIKELQIAVKMVFNVLNSNMPNKLSFAMLSIFKCIEIITYIYVEERYVEERRSKIAFWKGTNNEIKNTGYNKYRKDKNTTDIEHVEGEMKIRINKYGNISVENKIRTIMTEELNLSNNQLHINIKYMVCIRNHLIHQDKTYEDKDFCKNTTVKEITSDNIINWFKLVEKIIVSMDRQNESA